MTQQKWRRLLSGVPTSGEKQQAEDGSNRISCLGLSPQSPVGVRKTGDCMGNDMEKHSFSA